MRIYFDYNATTPLLPAVADAMSAAATRDLFGNASSVHYFGQQAKAAIDTARSSVASLIGADPSEVVFTGGGTESDNFAIRGAAEALEPTKRRHLIASAIEHEAVLNTLKALARRGLADDAAPRRSVGHRLAGSAARGDHRRHGARVGDAREQRDRHDSARRRAGGHRARARRADAHRRRAVGRQDSRRRPRARRRSAVALGAQVQRPEGRGRALDQARHAHAADADRRQARAQPPRGHGKRAGIVGMGVAARLSAEKRSAEAVRVGALRDRLEDGVLRSVPGTAVNGGADEPRAEHDQHQLRSRRGREPADRARPRRRRGVHRVGVLVGDARAVARAARDGIAGAPHAELAALQPRDCFRPTRKSIASSRSCRAWWKSCGLEKPQHLGSI